MRQRSGFAQLTVADVLARWPQTTRVFIRRRMACVGCAMARFDSVAYVAEAYRIPVEKLVDTLRRACGQDEARRPEGTLGGREERRGRARSATPR